MWADNETTEDLIGFDVHAELLKALITEEEILPLTIGLFGDWGNGKTSIMKMLAKKMEPDKNTLCIYFNGWLFEGYDDAKSAILNSIVLQLFQEKKDDKGVKETAQNLIASINWMRVMRLGAKNVGLPLIKAYMTGGLSLVSDIGSNVLEGEESEKEGLIDYEKFKKGDFADFDPMDVRSFRKKFSDLIDASKVDRLVILVDDLDRCSPNRLIDNLEAIKLFLNVDNTAFIIGADPRIIRFAISTRYNIPEISDEESEVKSDDLVRDYLEKLIQVPYHLPKLSPSEVETYMVLLFSKKELSEEDYHSILEAYRKKASENRYSTFGYSDVKNILKEDELSDQYLERLAFVASTSDLITEGLKGNPRQVKRFLNAFILRKKLAEAAKLENIEDKVLVKLMILEYIRPKLFKELFSLQAAQDGYPDLIKNLEDPESEVEIKDSWNLEIINKWIATDPPLSKYDLRDYFWVARDKLESTLSNLSLVAPIVKQLFQEIVSGIVHKVEKAVDDATALKEAEQIDLLELIKTNIIREPENFDNYQAFRFLVLKEITSSKEYFLDTLEQIPPKQLPPSLAVLIRGITDSFQGENKAKLDDLIVKLSESDTKIGKAIKAK